MTPVHTEILTGSRWQKNSKLLAANTPKNITFTQYTGNSLTHIFQYPVTSWVAKTVIHIFEKIHIEQDQADRCSTMLNPGFC